MSRLKEEEVEFVLISGGILCTVSFLCVIWVEQVVTFIIICRARIRHLARRIHNLREDARLKDRVKRAYEQDPEATVACLTDDWLSHWEQSNPESHSLTRTLARNLIVEEVYRFCERTTETPIHTLGRFALTLIHRLLRRFGKGPDLDKPEYPGRELAEPTERSS